MAWERASIRSGHALDGVTTGLRVEFFFSQMAASFLIESTVYFLFFCCDVVQDMKLNIHQAIYSVRVSALFGVSTIAGCAIVA